MRTLKRIDASPGRAGMYSYGPARIWISGPSGSTWWATVRFRSQERDLDARSLEAVLDMAKRWVDEAPELKGRDASRPRSRAAGPARRDASAASLRVYEAAHAYAVAQARGGASRLRASANASAASKKKRLEHLLRTVKTSSAAERGQVLSAAKRGYRDGRASVRKRGR